MFFVATLVVNRLFVNNVFSCYHMCVIIFCFRKAGLLTVSIILAAIGQLELAWESPSFPMAT